MPAVDRLDFLTQGRVKGLLLSERLAQGPLPPEEALRLAIALGGLIGRVHGRGLVHAAISPESIAIAEDGLRLLQPASSAKDHSAYSAPEQWRGQAADTRSDIFAFGAVVYEMVSGQRAFAGSGADLKQAILSRAPSPLAVKTAAGMALEGVIAGCLEKDPARRRQRIQNAVIELKLSGARTATRTEPAPRRRTALPASGAQPAAARPAVTFRANSLPRRAWILGAAVLALAASGVATALLLHRRPTSPVLKFAVPQPENTSYPGTPAVSPDGRFLTFSAVGPEGKRMLWLRPLDALHATVLDGTEGASAPFWSPDSQYIAFFTERSLKKVKITGGLPERICDAEASPGGGTWNRDGTILFSPSLADGFYQVPAVGGTPQLVLKVDESKGERGALWPQFLPDGKHFLFYQQADDVEAAGVYVGSMDSAESRRLFASQTNAVYAVSAANSQGYLLYIHERNLTAAPFHAANLEVSGAAKVLADDIGAVRSLSLAPISVSENGVLVYQGVGQPTRQLLWLDRSGRQIAVCGEPGEYGPPRVSPDGSRGVVAKAEKDGNTAQLWLVNRDGTAAQISHSQNYEGSPVWSPDGARIAYFVRQDKVDDLYVRSTIPDSLPELLFHSDVSKHATDWSRDGKYILYGVQGAGTRLDVWGFSADNRTAAPILNTVYAEGFAALSPDGRWLAYQSDQSGRNEVYIQTFDGLSAGTRRRWQISNSGGLPRWRSDGSELFYITPDGRMMSTPIRGAAGGGIDPGQSQVLFQTRPVPQTWNLYDVSPDGQRFLFNVPLEWTRANPITVVTNWTEKLREE